MWDLWKKMVELNAKSAGTIKDHYNCTVEEGKEEGRKALYGTPKNHFRIFASKDFHLFVLIFYSIYSIP